MISIYQGDITGLQVDAIVNAANESLLGGGGVDGAIHRAAGPELHEYCKTLHGCAVGQAKLTPGFRLPAKWIIHTVGPVWKGGMQGEAALLASCYRNSLVLGVETGVRTIAFPLISTGAYGYPKLQAAGIALREMFEFEQQYEEIICCCFSEADYRLCRDLLQKQSPGEPGF